MRAFPLPPGRLQAAYLLARLGASDDAKRFMAHEPTRFAGYSVSTDVSAPDAVKLLTEAVRAGAHGFGEVKFHVAADGPEMRRLYAAAAELDVPVTLHFQEVPHTDQGCLQHWFQTLR